MLSPKLLAFEAPTRPKAEDVRMDGRKARVLVVDDNDALRETLGAVLEAAGYEVTCAESGSAALESIVDAPPDLILLDIMMPGMGGVELLRTLRKHGDMNPFGIIAMSGYVTASASPAKWFLRKPLDLDLTLAIVADFCATVGATAKVGRKERTSEIRTRSPVLRTRSA